jgi:hypothetical protein
LVCVLGLMLPESAQLLVLFIETDCEISFTRH